MVALASVVVIEARTRTAAVSPARCVLVAGEADELAVVDQNVAVTGVQHASAAHNLAALVDDKETVLRRAERADVLNDNAVTSLFRCIQAKAVDIEFVVLLLEVVAVAVSLAARCECKGSRAVRELHRDFLACLHGAVVHLIRREEVQIRLLDAVHIALDEVLCAPGIHIVLRDKFALRAVKEDKARLHAADAVECILAAADLQNLIAVRSALRVGSPPGALEIQVRILIEVCRRIHPEPLVLHQRTAVVAVVVAHALIGGRVGANRVRDARDLVPPLDHDALLIEAVGRAVDVALERLLARATPVLLRVRPEVEPHLLVVLVAATCHLTREVGTPVVVEPAVRVERTVGIRVVARVDKRILVAEDIALLVDPAGQHVAVLIERIVLAVDFLAETLALRAIALAVGTEVVPAAVAVIAGRIALVVNEDPGIFCHAAVLVDIVVRPAVGENAVLQKNSGVAKVEPIFLRLLEGIGHRLILPVQVLPLVSDFVPALNRIGCHGRKKASSSCRQQKRSGRFDMFRLFHVPPLSLCTAG